MKEDLWGFKGVQAELKNELKRRGYSAKGSTFARLHPSGNSLLIASQRSTKSTHLETLVTLNYGVYSAQIGRWLEDEPTAARDITRAHWRRRIRESGREKWIRIASESSNEDASRELLEQLSLAATDLENHGSDENLRDDWLVGVSPGLTEIERLLYLAILLHQIGPRDRLAEVLAALRSLVEGRPQEGIVRRQLRTIWVTQ